MQVENLSRRYANSQSPCLTYTTTAIAVFELAAPAAIAVVDQVVFENAADHPLVSTLTCSAAGSTPYTKNLPVIGLIRELAS